MTLGRLVAVVLVLACASCGGGGSTSDEKPHGGPLIPTNHAYDAAGADGRAPLDGGSLDASTPVDDVADDSYDGGEPEGAPYEAATEAAAADVAVDTAPEAAPDALVAVETTLAFGPVILKTPATLPVDLQNSGSSSLTVSSAVVTGAGFSVDTSTLPLSIAGGGKASLTVTFLPTKAGSVTGTLAITSDEGSASVALSGQGIHSVDLSWTASTSSDVVGYNVYRGTKSGGPYTKINTALVTGTTYVDATVMGCTTYYYVTTAVNSMGLESAYSAEVSAAVPCP
jgi:hypothetical protein